MSCGSVEEPAQHRRTYRTFREVSRLPKGQQLDDVVPAALYERFDDLKARYLPRDDSLEELAPYYASMEMTQQISGRAEPRAVRTRHEGHRPFRAT
jgi:hypothetical protein